MVYLRSNLELELVHRGGNLCCGGASDAAQRSCLSKYTHTHTHTHTQTTTHPNPPHPHTHTHTHTRTHTPASIEITSKSRLGKLGMQIKSLQKNEKSETMVLQSVLAPMRTLHEDAMK